MSQPNDVQPGRLRAPVAGSSNLPAAEGLVRTARPMFLVLTLAVAAGCGSDSHPSANKNDAGDAAAAGGRSSTTDAGTGGMKVTDGGMHHDGGKPSKDDVPPTFNGISKIEALTEATVRVSWDAAMDNVTASSAMGYRVYRAAKKGGEDYTRKRRCGDVAADASAAAQVDLPCYTTAVSGSTSAVVRSAAAGKALYYVARAVDAAGNEDSNTNEASATTKDETPPIFGGVDSIAALGATSVEVAWGAAFDSTSPDPTLTYEVFLGTSTPDPDKDDPAVTTKPGEHSAIISKLDPLTTYHTIVRAKDPAGNVDTNTYSLAVTTPEGIAPTFTGVKRANAIGNRVQLFWLPASDNVSHPENIVYDIYTSFTQHHEDFTKQPHATTPPGVASYVLTEANLATKYFYVVRARDVAGNQDTNIIETSALTGPLPDNKPPTFNGAQLVAGSSPTSLKVTWNAAADETSTQLEDFTYLVYVSQGTPVPLTTPAVTVRGSLSTVLVGLTPGTTYNVVVVAKDAAGNASAAQAATSGQTGAADPDKTPPTFSTTPPTAGMNTSAPSQLNVSWTAATDDTSAATDIRYHVCVSKTKSDCQGGSFSAHIAATTAYGATKATVPYLEPRTPYFVFVKAEDRAGNLDKGDNFAQATTATSWTDNVKPLLITHCLSCHDYDNAGNMVNVLSTFAQGPNEEKSCTVFPKDLMVCLLPIVDPGQPKFSLLYRRVNPLGLTTQPFSAQLPNQYSGAREPRDTGASLTAEEDSILFDWITQGALTF